MLNEKHRRMIIGQMNSLATTVVATAESFEVACLAIL